jgi:hypothetical protein
MRRGRRTSYPGEWVPHRRRHAVSLASPAYTVCGIPTADLVRFPHLDFQTMHAVDCCPECLQQVT